MDGWMDRQKPVWGLFSEAQDSGKNFGGGLPKTTVQLYTMSSDGGAAREGGDGLLMDN